MKGKKRLWSLILILSFLLQLGLPTTLVHAGKETDINLDKPIEREILDESGDNSKSNSEEGGIEDIDLGKNTTDKDLMTVLNQFLTKVELLDKSGNPLPLDGELPQIKNGDEIRLKYNYKIEDKLKIDTSKLYTFKIPSKMKLMEAIDFKLIDKSDTSKSYGTVSIKEDGTASVEFDEHVNKDLYDRAGNFYVNTKFSVEKGNDRIEEVEFDLGPNTKQTIKIKVIQPETKLELYKEGNYDSIDNIIYWTVSFNGPVKDILIVDNLDPKLSFDENKLKINGIEFNKLEKNNIKVENSSYDPATNKISFNLTCNAEKIKITYPSEIKDYQASQEEHLKYTNKVTVDGHEATSTIPYLPNKKFEKWGSYYNVDNHMITWNLDVNRFEENWSDITITDVLPEGLEIKEDWLKDKQLFYVKVRNKDQWEDGEISDIGKFSYDTASKTLTFKLEKTNKHFKVFFHTRNTDPYGTTFIKPNGRFQIDNKASIEYKDKDGKVQNLDANGVCGYKINLLDKAGQIDKSKDIDWTININTDKAKLPKPKIEDNLDKYLTLKEESIILYKVGEENNNLIGSIADYGYDANNLFTLEFSEDIEDAYVLKFKTLVDGEKKENGQIIKNSVKLIGTEDRVIEGETSVEIVKQTGGGEGISSTRGSLKLKKLDKKTNLPLIGAKFKLFDTIENKEIVKTVESNDGILIFNDLYLNRLYKLTEVQAPNGYIIDSVSKDIKITKDIKDGILEYSFPNTKKPVEPDKPDPENPDPGKPIEPGKPDPEKPEPVKPITPEKPDPVKPEPEKPQPEKPDPVKPITPEKPDPAKPEPEKPQPEKPDPAKPILPKTGNECNSVLLLGIGLLAIGLILSRKSLNSK